MPIIFRYIYISFLASNPIYSVTYLTLTPGCHKPNVSPNTVLLRLSVFASAHETCSSVFPVSNNWYLHLLGCFYQELRGIPFFSLSLTPYIHLITRCCLFCPDIQLNIHSFPYNLIATTLQLNRHYPTAVRHHLSLRPLISESNSSFPVLSLLNTFSLWQP